ncbi:MAG TPA: phytanoyl-CoA dioxygenase family protein, partial [Burkholderiales bacterium]|nr:phytanoyl-CoA dioxygenase family protein [Burkholderiales bacterium]
MISSKQVESYRENGYLVVENVLDAETLDRVRAVTAELVARAKGLTTHNEIYDLEPTHMPDEPRVRRIKTPHKWHPLFWEIARSPRMAEVLKALLGP